MKADTIQIQRLGFPTRTEVENETTCGNGISPFSVHVFILLFFQWLQYFQHLNLAHPSPTCSPALAKQSLSLNAECQELSPDCVGFSRFILLHHHNPQDNSPLPPRSHCYSGSQYQPFLPSGSAGYTAVKKYQRVLYTPDPSSSSLHSLAQKGPRKETAEREIGRKVISKLLYQVFSPSHSPKYQ